MDHRLQRLFVVVCITLLSDVLAAGAYDGNGQEDLLGHACTAKTREKCCGGRELACIDNACSYCQTSADCDDALSVCVAKTDQRAHESGGRVCVLKFPSELTVGAVLASVIHWFQHSSSSDITAICICIVAGGMASAGGLGGGILFMPLMVLSGYSAHFATQTSESMIVGMSIGNMVISAAKKHPLFDRPLIDYDAAMGLLPLIVAGTVPGVLLNQMLPSWSILYLLMLVLFWVINKGYKKAMTIYRAEQRAKAAEEEKSNPANGSTSGTDKVAIKVDSAAAAPTAATPLLAGESDGYGSAPTESKAAELDRLLEGDRHTPRQRVAQFSLFMALILFLVYLPGRKTASSFLHVPMCSSTYWVLFAVPFPVIFAGSAVIIWYLIGQHRQKESLGYVFKDFETAWSRDVALRTAPMCVLVGVLVGILGIGGGVMMTPMLLDLGLHPQAQAATSSFMILFISISAAVQFFVAGLLRVDYLIIYSAAGFVSALVGLTSINFFVKKYRMASLVVFVLLATMILSAVLCLVLGTSMFVYGIQNHVNLSLTPVC